MSAVACPLFKRFPELEPQLPWIDLCGGPSPVRPLKSLERRLGMSGLWIKNDGLLGAEYGGNKVRKLEFVLAQAQQRNASGLITFGGVGSHHCLATAVYGRRLGFDVSVVLMEQPITDEVEANLAALGRLGARVIRAGGLQSMVLKSGIEIGRSVISALPRRLPYLVWVGASTPRGCLGYVSAAHELRDQIEQGELPKPASIVLPLASNGTAAGLLAGLRLANLDIKLVAVPVSDMLGTGAAGVARLAKHTLGFMRRHGANLPSYHFGPDDLTTIGDPGTARYGHPTASGREAKRIMYELEGVELDLTYTAKAVSQLMMRDDLPMPVLYWHTLNAHPETAGT